MGWQDEDILEERDEFTHPMVFRESGTLPRSNYRRQWVGFDYRILCGKFKGELLSTITSEKWIMWALNKFEDTLPHNLQRALIDQLNSLHK